MWPSMQWRLNTRFCMIKYEVDIEVNNLKTDYFQLIADSAVKWLIGVIRINHF